MSPADLNETTLRRIVAEEVRAGVAEILAAVAGTQGASDAPALVTRTQLQEILRVDVRTLRRLEREGAIPRPISIAGRIDRWDRRTIDAWLAAGGGIPAPTLRARRRSGSVSAHGDRRS